MGLGLLAGILTGEILRILVDTGAETCVEAGGEGDGSVAVLVADAVDRFQGLTPARGFFLVEKIGLAFAGFERLSVDADQSDGLAGPRFVKERTGGFGELGINL